MTTKQRKETGEEEGTITPIILRIPLLRSLCLGTSIVSLILPSSHNSQQQKQNVQRPSLLLFKAHLSFFAN